MYEKDEGVAEDAAEAVKWYSKAAEQGHARAQFRLGGLYFGGGWGVPPDYVPARMWFDIAAAHGLEEAKTFRDFFAGEMTPERLAESKRLTREWMEKHQPTSTAFSEVPRPRP